jgi:N-acetylmuramic acid 6-phosphate etherase
MRPRQTEAQHIAAKGLDARSDAQILAVLLDGQVQAVNSLALMLPQVAAGATLMAHTVTSGGRLIYAAAGSSGMMAFADAVELGGTFGIPPAQIHILMAGGLPVDARMPGSTEDDTDDALAAAAVIQSGDAVITLSASGSTPYSILIAQIARERGAQVIGISNNAGAALFDHADIAIHAPTPPEVIAGSTRLGAGTAQKVVLNMMSTLMGIRLGHVHDGMMVNLVADNEKLRGRAAGMVAQIANVDTDSAKASLEKAGGVVKLAVLLASGADAAIAGQLLDDTKGNLRAALARL